MRQICLTGSPIQLEIDFALQISGVASDSVLVSVAGAGSALAQAEITVRH